MINLVTTGQAVRHLRLDPEDVANITDLEMKIQEATEIILDYLKIPVPEHTSPVEDSPTYDYWANNPSAVPFNIKAATLLVLGDLWENREATTTNGNRTNDPLSDAVKNLLHRRRDPSMA